MRNLIYLLMCPAIALAVGIGNDNPAGVSSASAAAISSAQASALAASIAASKSSSQGGNATGGNATGGNAITGPSSATAEGGKATSSATGGNSTTGPSTSNSGGNSQSSSTGPSSSSATGGGNSQSIKYDAPAYAPAAIPTAPCRVSVSGGVVGAVIGFSVEDEPCNLRFFSDTLASRGKYDAAVKILCLDERTAWALGPEDCPSKSRDTSKACWQDEIIAKRMGAPVCQ